jgi:hypothetical protein
LTEYVSINHVCLCFLCLHSLSYCHSIALWYMHSNVVCCCAYILSLSPVILKLIKIAHQLLLFVYIFVSCVMLLLLSPPYTLALSTKSCCCDSLSTHPLISILTLLFLVIFCAIVFYFVLLVIIMFFFLFKYNFHYVSYNREALSIYNYIV